jgi:hypothetical protein
MASIASATLKPSSWACRAVDSTPALVATPTCVTSDCRRYFSRSVPVKAVHVRLVTTWSACCRLSSGRRSVHPGGNALSARARPARPGAVPSALMRTTGSCARERPRPARRPCSRCHRSDARPADRGWPSASRPRAGPPSGRVNLPSCSCSPLQLVRRPRSRPQSSTRRLSRLIAAASCACCCGVSLDWIVLSSQSCRAARPLRINSRQAGVNDRIVCRPSVASGDPLISLKASSPATVAPMDCGRTPSIRASAVTVVGPCRSRCRSTANCDCVRSPADACSRSRRFNLPLSACSAAARAEVLSASGSVLRLLMPKT